MTLLTLWHVDAPWECLNSVTNIYNFSCRQNRCSQSISFLVAQILPCMEKTAVNWRIKVSRFYIRIDQTWQKVNRFLDLFRNPDLYFWNWVHSSSILSSWSFLLRISVELSLSYGIISVCSTGVIFVRLQHPPHISTSFRNGSGNGFERSNVPRKIVSNRE